MHSRNLEITPRQAEAILMPWLGQTVCCTGIQRLLGGEIHSAFGLEFDCEPFKAVIKLRDSDDESFEGEKQRLDYLREKGLRVPEVFAVGEPNDLNEFSHILLERLPGVTLDAVRMTGNNRREFDRFLAEEVLKLHANTRDTFGEINDRFATKQWADIVVPRLVDMRDEMRDKLPAEVLDPNRYEKRFSGSRSPLRYQRQGLPVPAGFSPCLKRATLRGAHFPLRKGRNTNIQRPTLLRPKALRRTGCPTSLSTER